MVCAAPRTGRLGFVGDYTGAVLSRFQRVRNWRLNALANPEQRVYSGTRYGTQRINAFVDYTGSFEGYGANPPLFVGDQFTFIGYTAPTTGVPCTPGCAYSMLSMVDTLTITWNWTQENMKIFWNIGFSAIGAPTTTAAFDDPCDDAVFCDANACDLVLVLKDPCAADAVVEFCNLTSATLSFTANSIVYSNSSTGCRPKREPGNLDWTLEVPDQNPCIIPTIQADYLIELPASATTKWILKWGKYLGARDFIVDMEANTLVGKTNVFAMNAVGCCVPGTPVRGSIVDPDAATLWPYATPV